MSQAYIIYMAKEALGTAIIVGGPLLLITLLVGLVVSIFQAMTQIQEQTLTFIPKILAMALILLLLGPWMLDVMTAYTINLFNELATYARY